MANWNELRGHFENYYDSEYRRLDFSGVGAKINVVWFQLFKDALEKMVDTEAQLLNATELKIIFGHLPPIYTAHCCMLEELKQMAGRWSDDTSVGQLILKYVRKLYRSCYIPVWNGNLIFWFLLRSQMI